MSTKSVNRALKTLRLARRSFRGDCCPKGTGKTQAHKAERRVGKALSSDREES